MGKIIGVNLLILLGYSMLLKLKGDDSVIGLLAALIFFHFIINLTQAISKENIKNRPAFLISAFLVLIIGFATCGQFFLQDGIG
jgi:hypothetical protein